MTPFPFLTGPLARAGTGLVPLGAPGPSLPLAALLAPGGVEAMLAPLLRRHPGQDRRALLSLWSRFYFYTLIPPVVLTLLLSHRALPLAPRDGAVMLNEQGLPAAIALPDAGREAPPPADAFIRFAPLVQEHLAPLIAHWAAEAKLAPRVLWANAASYFAWIVREIAMGEGMPPGSAAPGQVIVETARWSDGSANPLHEPMRLMEGPEGPQHWRKVCCLLYRLPERKECPYCPLLLRGGGSRNCAGEA